MLKVSIKLKPFACSLIYEALIDVPNIQSIFISPSRVNTQTLCSSPRCNLYTRCLVYGSQEYVDYDFNQDIEYSEEGTFCRHISLQGEEGVERLGVLDIAYALMRIYIHGGVIDTSRREELLDFIYKILKRTKPSCKNILNNYIEWIGLDSFLELEDDEVLDILFEQVLIHHCEFIEVGIDLQDILEGINEIICPDI